MHEITTYEHYQALTPENKQKINLLIAELIEKQRKGAGDCGQST